MNGVRASHGLAPLRLDVRLLRAARGHSADMLHRQYFAHGSVAGRALAQGARGPVFGENLAWGTGADRPVGRRPVAREPGAPREPAAPGFRRVGIGIALGTFAGHGGAAVVTRRLRAAR